MQENILFGAPLDPDLYDSVKEACALAHDISTFPEGDETEIGASTISGGQKTRIALARCVYRALLGGRRPRELDSARGHFAAMQVKTGRRTLCKHSCTPSYLSFN